MKFRTVGRHIRESFKSLYRNGWMTFAAASAVTVTLILVSVVFCNIDQHEQACNGCRKQCTN